MSATPSEGLVLKIGEQFNGTVWIRNKKTKIGIDIQNTLWKAGVKEDIEDADELQAFTMSAPFQDPDDGYWKVSMTMTAAQIAALGISEGVYDVWYSDDAGATWRKAGRGSITVELKATDLT